VLADSQNILSGMKNDFCQISNVYGVTDVRQTDMHTGEQSVPEPSTLDIQIATGKLNIHVKSSRNEQEPIHYVLRSTNLLNRER
jgi:hypothetical protein